MLAFELYKTKLFPDPDSQKAFIEAINAKGYGTCNDFDEAYYLLIHKVEESDFQTILAPFLRERAINHLRTAETSLAQGFREQFELAFAGLDQHEPGDVSSLPAFFEQQGKAYVYATDIEAGALAEYLGVNFACTRVGPNNYPTDEPMYLYYQAPNEDAITVHLFNSPGTHFFIHEGQFASTVGDGNCLYNGFSQILRQAILLEEDPEMMVCFVQYNIYSKIESATPLTLNDFITKVWGKNRSELAKHVDYGVAINLAKQDVDFNKVISSTQPPGFSEFETQRKLIEDKGTQFAEKYKNNPKVLLSFFDINYQEASKKALWLADRLNTLLTDYQKTEATPQTTATFKNECLTAIDTVSGVLKQHRGFKKILRDLIEALFSGLPYIYDQWTNGSWFFNTPTDSTIKLNKMRDVVEQMAP